MPKTGDLIVVHLVEKQKVGYRFGRHRSDWPLHITLTPWFGVTNESVARENLTTIAVYNLPFPAVVGSKQSFGARQEVSVNIIKDQTELRTLHQKIIDSLRKLPVRFESERWIDQDYRAHITRHEGDAKWREEGDVLNIRDFHLIRLLDGDVCEVVQRFELKGNHE